MKPKKLSLPPELSTFIDAGNTTLSCDDGDWDLRIAPREDSPFRKELPSGSVMLAENGCGDCLFLKTSKAGKIAPKVFVFWHEEERCEVFAKHLKELTTRPENPKEMAISSTPLQAMTVAELESALQSADLKIRDEAIKRFSKTAFGIEALPTLRKALDDDWVGVVLTAADCIGELGPKTLSFPAAKGKDGSWFGGLESQLILAGSKVWSYSMYPNCYSSCLNALVKLKADGDHILGYVQSHIGLDDDDLIDSLNALKAVGSEESLNLLKRAVEFWLPELNMRYAKEVKKILDAATK